MKRLSTRRFLASTVASSIAFPSLFVAIPAAATEALQAEAVEAEAVEAEAEDSSSEGVASELPAETAISAETVAKVEELLRITENGELNVQVMESIVAQFRRVMTEIPDDWWDRFLEKIDYEAFDRLVIPIYARHFTIEELDAIIAFYKTPAGQSVLDKMPLVLQDSMLIGQQWGIGIAQQIIEDLEAEGYAVPDEPFVL